MFRGRFFEGNSFSRRTRRGSSFQKGDLKYVILNLMKEKPRHGYEIIRELEDQSHGLYKPSPGVIYPTLQMLEEMGYAVSSEQESKKVYTITDEGLRFLEQQKDQANGVRSHIRRSWSFKKLGRMALVMKEYHALEHLLGDSFRQLDADKAARIREVLIQAYDNIEAIIEE
jgi:DNA-binding PadR family transcriptional regulator